MSIASFDSKPTNTQGLYSGLFTVVMASYSRGRHIRPSIESVLRQSFQDFELLVVSDGPDEDTQAIVEGLASPKVRWIAMREHHGSQTFPNNCGIAESAGRWIAYLGHDDIWANSHLAALAHAIGSAAAPEVAVSGCIYHAPANTRMAWVTGLFDGNGAEHSHFFPPSSFAHRREALTRLGGWRAPETIVPPVDDDVLLRFARAGHRFASTGRVTVHKFAAGHRYLSYLDPDAHEQEAMLRDPRLDHPDAWGDVIALARANEGHFLRPDYSGFAAGEIFASSRQKRGLALAPTRRLEGRQVVTQDNGPRALDWHPLEQAPDPFRWSGPNPKPKILIPFAYDGDARVVLRVVEYHGPLREITARARGVALAVSVSDDERGASLCMEVTLQPTGPTVIELTTPAMFRPNDDRTDAPRLGIALADMVIEPAT